MKLDLETQMLDSKGEPFVDTNINLALLWARLRFLAREGRGFKEGLDLIEEENGCKDIPGRELVRPMTLGDAIWKACYDSPDHAGAGEGTKGKKLALARLADKAVRHGVVDFTDSEIELFEKQAERFHGGMLLAIDKVLTKARAERDAEADRPKAATG